MLQKFYVRPECLKNEISLQVITMLVILGTDYFRPPDPAQKLLNLLLLLGAHVSDLFPWHGKMFG